MKFIHVQFEIATQEKLCINDKFLSKNGNWELGEPDKFTWLVESES